MPPSTPLRARSTGNSGNRRVSGFARALFIGLTILLTTARAATAQEVQIPFDDAGTILVVEAEDARRLGLFVDEYPGFEEARLFQTGGAVTLELLVRGDAGVTRITRTLSAAEVDDLRAQIALARSSPQVVPTTNARSLLLASSTLLGLTVYGPSIPIALDVEDNKSATALYMAVASASFFVPWMLTSDVTPAMAQAGYYGSTRGFVHGSGLHYLLAGEDEAACDLEDCDYFRQSLASGVVLGAVEGILGYRWARSSGMTGGEANAISLGGDVGMMNGFGLGALIDGEDDDDVDDDERLTVALGLTGAAGGLLLGRLAADQRDFSYGDVEILGTSSSLGAFVGYIIADEISDESRVGTGAAMAGSLLGLAAADRLVADADFTYGQSTLVRLGTLAGGLLGYGAGVLLESESDDLTGITSAAGALAGFAATYRTVERSARAGGRSANVELNLAPHGLASLLSPGLLPQPGFATPVASVTYRF